MDKKENEFSDVEQELRRKMDELASSVDCFDKISNRAFPKNKPEHPEYEYTESSLEKVGEKSGFAQYIPVIGVIAVLVICAVLIPLSGIFSGLDFFGKVSKNTNVETAQDRFTLIMDEIDSELNENRYAIYDVPLSVLTKNDAVLLPLEKCPFGESGDEDIMVRLFVRMIGNDIYTNQVYAVEYKGSYSDEDYIAAAKTKVEFGYDELYSLYEKYMDYYKRPSSETNAGSRVYNLVGCLYDDMYSGVETPEYMVSRALAAGFSYKCIYKLDDKVYPLTNEIIYYKSKRDKDFKYCYDIVSSYIDSDGSEREFSEFSVRDNRDSLWEDVAYANGALSFSNSYRSDFRPVDLTVYERKYDGMVCYLEENMTKYRSTDPLISCTFTKGSRRREADGSYYEASAVAPEFARDFKVYIPYFKDENSFDLSVENSYNSNSSRVDVCLAELENGVTVSDTGSKD